MSGSKTTKFFNFLADRLAPSPAFDPGQQAHQSFSYQQQYLAAQYPAGQYGQQQRAQGAQYSGPATATGHGRQHIGDHIQGDDSRTHASDSATQYNDRVFYGSHFPSGRLYGG